MKLGISIYFLLLINANMLAQPVPKSLPGEYYLSGVMETASGFKLNGDKTYEFFFSQGALDRTSKGTWQYNKGNVIFNSDKAPEHNFAIISSRKVDDDGFSVQIVDNNQSLIRYVEVYYKIGEEVIFERTDNEGLVRFPKPIPDELILVFYFSPERQSSFKLENKEHNYYEFRFEPWVFEVFLDNFTLKYKEGKLLGGHPLMDGHKFKYIRN